MKYAITVLIVSVLLSACAGTASDEALRRVTAPDVVEYTPQQQDQAAREIESGQCPMLETFAADYCVMRDQSRLLMGQKTTCVNP